MNVPSCTRIISLSEGVARANDQECFQKQGWCSQVPPEENVHRGLAESLVLSGTKHGETPTAQRASVPHLAATSPCRSQPHNALASLAPLEQLQGTQITAAPPAQSGQPLPGPTFPLPSPAPRPWSVRPGEQSRGPEALDPGGLGSVGSRWAGSWIPGLFPGTQLRDKATWGPHPLSNNFMFTSGLLGALGVSP